MTKYSLALLATTTLLAGSALAETNCTVDVTNKALAIANNATYLNSCSPGSKWKLTTMFDAVNLTSTDFLMFCNVSTCMDPMHALFDDVPEDCIATYNGTAGEKLGDAIGQFYIKCHDAVRSVDGDSQSEDDKNSSKPNTVPAATPKKSLAASPLTHATVAVAMVASTIAALVL